MRILFLADTHGTLGEVPKADFCFMLGDHSVGDVKKVLKVYPEDKIWGLIGNHDMPAGKLGSYIDYVQHLDMVELNGVRFRGVDGCLKYKEGYGKPYQWTSDEYLEYVETFPPCDVLLTHTSSMLFSLKPGNAAHQGVEAFNRYCERGVKHHIHGHNHLNGTMLHNGWFETCVYGARIIRF